MLQHLRANLWLVFLTVLLSSVIYPGILWLIGDTAFPEKAAGSLILDRDRRPLGSRLIAQPFTADRYFQPRPSAASYNGAASGASNWGACNPLLRDRVARQLGPIVKYRSGPRKGQPVGPDIESWLQKDLLQGSPGIVARWAEAYPTLAQNWVKADRLNGEYVLDWQKSHPSEAAAWLRDNPDHPQPKPEELAVAFWKSFSREHPGAFPVAVEKRTADGRTEKRIEPAGAGPDVQGTFFDLWLEEHPQADLEPVPADMVMASGSGLDPHITLKNALYQLDRVAGAWAERTRRPVQEVRKEIEGLLREKAEAPLGGLVGVEQVNVLETNLALKDRYAPPGEGN